MEVCISLLIVIKIRIFFREEELLLLQAQGAFEMRRKPRRRDTNWIERGGESRAI